MGGAGDIPFSSIDRYARRYGIQSIDRFDELRRIMRGMDVEFKKLVNTKPGDKSFQVPVTDVEGIKSLFKRLGTNPPAKTKLPVQEA